MIPHWLPKRVLKCLRKSCSQLAMHAICSNGSLGRSVNDIEAGA